jgi:hypothetical protein
MQPKIEQLLGTIEVFLEQRLSFGLPYHENSAMLKPYCWDISLSGSFSPLKLIRAENWIAQTDPEVAVQNWKWSEEIGLAAPGMLECDHLCEEDDEGIKLDYAAKLARSVQYQDLLEYVSVHLKSLAAYTLSCSSYYSLSLIVGQLPDQRWICILPTVPQETPNFANKEMKCTLLEPTEPSLRTISDVEAIIQRKLDDIKSIQTYGWYDGGYNHVHTYRITHAADETSELAIETALVKAGLIEIYQFDQFDLGEQLCGYGSEEGRKVSERFQHFNQFLKQVFLDLQLYRFCFWDYEHLYFLNSQQFDDKAGISLHSQFTYNP